MYENRFRIDCVNIGRPLKQLRFRIDSELIFSESILNQFFFTHDGTIFTESDVNFRYIFSIIFSIILAAAKGRYSIFFMLILCVFKMSTKNKTKTERKLTSLSSQQSDVKFDIFFR